MKKNLWIIGYLTGWFLLMACSDSAEVAEAVEELAGETCIEISTGEMPVIDTRAAAGEERQPDACVEHVIVYAFDKITGQMLTRYQQDLDDPDREVRMMLPKNKNLVLHAVCNYPELWGQAVQHLDDLHRVMLVLQQPDDVYNGVLVMHGEVEAAAVHVADKQYVHRIQVTRLAARVELTLQFAPEVATDQFYLSSVKLCNIPKQSWLVAQPQQDISQSAAGDAVYVADPALFQKNFFTEYLLPVHTDPVTHQHKVNCYLFENRRGGESTDLYFQRVFASNREMWQTLKGQLAREKYALGSYLLVEGVYKTKTSTLKVAYRMYLGADNYKDFNVRRNHQYRVNGIIKTCNRMDTRVDALVLNSSVLTPSFTNPLDAHFNSVHCLAVSRHSDWELYVEDPDLHPWLEISFDSRYRPRIIGQSVAPGESHLYATTRLEGKQPLSGYFYIHTDEYVPQNASADGSLNDVQNPAHWRSAFVVLHDRTNGSKVRLEVRQRPAQVVRMPKYNLLGQVVGYHDYFIEYELESKHLQWGFLRYPANPVMTSMINDRWDGLANTRRLYQEAVKPGGAYNRVKPYKLQADAVAGIPSTDMMGYVLTKNRDRNGNGYIDYEEIVWYVPALDELAHLRSVLDAGHAVFQQSDDKFHSSTPYLSGYTAEVPGRAFYVKMRQGTKAFAMRNRCYQVLCCRRKGAWQGNLDAGIGGDIQVDSGWGTDDEQILKK